MPVFVTICAAWIWVPAWALDVAKNVAAVLKMTLANQTPTAGNAMETDDYRLYLIARALLHERALEPFDRVFGRARDSPMTDDPRLFHAPLPLAQLRPNQLASFVPDAFPWCGGGSASERRRRGANANGMLPTTLAPSAAAGPAEADSTAWISFPRAERSPSR